MRYKNLLTKCLGLFFCLMTACSSSSIQTQSSNGSQDNNPSPPSLTTAESFAKASTQLNVLSLGSDFPPAIQIPDIDGLRSTAFVVSFLPAVLAVDLDANPITLSKTFKGFDATTTPEVAFPSKIKILNTTMGLLLGTSDFVGTSALVVFNPTTGQKLDSLNLSQTITLNQALPFSRAADCDGNGTTQSSIPAGPYNPNYAADMAVVDNHLFVTMSNLCFDGSGSVYTQGLVMIYDIHNNAPFFTPASTPYLIVAGFNVTALTLVDDRLVVTASGDTNLSGSVSTPESDSFLTRIDPNGLTLAGILNLGKVAANFQSLALTSDHSRGFVGSSSFSEVYAIDLDHFSVLRGINDPITVFDGADFISDQSVAFGDHVLFVSSFNNSALRAIDLDDQDLGVLPTVLNFGFEGNPGTTGAGPMALRPGMPGDDFQGPDLWVLTSNPGTLSSAKTY